MTTNELALLEELRDTVRQIKVQNRRLIAKVNELSRVQSEFEGTDVM